jgi:monoterpene epsilon-lactone hydrolase
MTPERPSAEMAAILELGGSYGLPDQDRVEDRRVTAEAALLGPLAAGTNAKVGPLGGRPALWIRPDELGDTDSPVLLYLHGGAFEVCSPRAYEAFCSRLAMRLNATVVVPDYRLAPEHPFPAAIDDAVAAYRDLLDAGRPASTLALMGDSAGGGLVLSCLIAAKREGLPQPAAAVALSAWADLTLAADSHRRCAETDPFIRTAMLQRAAQHYLDGWDAEDPLASPAHAAVDELTGLAPVLLQAAANEVLADDSATVAERIATAGGDVTLELCSEAFHVWQMAGDGVPESEAALSSLTRFVREHWSKADNETDDR